MSTLLMSEIIVMSVFDSVLPIVISLNLEKEKVKCIYRTRAIITRSWSVTALVYKPRILGLENKEFPFLVHKWSVI